MYLFSALFTRLILRKDSPKGLVELIEKRQQCPDKITVAVCK